MRRILILAAFLLLHAAVVRAGVCDEAYTMPYSLDVAPYTSALPDGGGTGSVQVYAPAGCSWSAVVSAGGDWLTLSGASSGSGNGGVVFAYAANPFGSARGATVSVRFADGVVWNAVYEQGPSAAGQYTAGGKVFGLIGQVASGVVLSFKVVSGSCPAMLGVLSRQDGTWSQTGFKPGCVYEVSPRRGTDRFRLAFQRFNAATSALKFYQY